MPPKPRNYRLLLKMSLTFLSISLGGPALIYYVSPTEEELFLKYNPELQKRSLENREQRQQDFDDFVMRLRELSKSDRPIWDAYAISEKQNKEGKIAAEAKLMQEMRDRKEEIRKSTPLVPGGSL